MEKEPEKAEGEAEPVSGQSVASDLTYEEARALSAPVREEPPAVPEEAQIESAQPETMLPEAHPETVSGPDTTTSEATRDTVPKAPRGRLRKGKESGTRWTCPQCGKNLSSGTKSHVCRPCTKENTPPAAPAALPPVASPSAEPLPQPPGSVPSAEPLPQPLPITLDDVTNFLYGEVRARRNARRERISAQLF